MFKYKNIHYSSDISYAKISDEIFVFKESTNKVHLFKGLNSKIWKSIEKETELNNIVENLNKQEDYYNVEKEDAIKSLNLFFKYDLIEERSEL